MAAAGSFAGSVASSRLSVFVSASVPSSSFAGRRLQEGAKQRNGAGRWAPPGRGGGGCDRGALIVRNIGWDPEGILAAPSGNHLARRQMSADKQLAEEARKEADRRLEESERIKRERRAARSVPETPSDLIQYFLETNEEDFEYETARYRPRMDEAFFSQLDRDIGTARFSNSVKDQEKVQVMEKLKDILKEGVASLDEMTSKMVSAQSRLRQVLTAADKKAQLLKLAEENQIDSAFITLLEQNTASARTAGQEEVAKLLEKIREVSLKYVVR
eukprot:jgi/Chlat1/9250/Chrsp99S08523